MLDLIRTTAPADTPISLEDVKANLRVDAADEDDLLETYIDAAVATLDGYSGTLGRCLVDQVWTLYLDRFPGAGCGPALTGAVWPNGSSPPPPSRYAIRLPLPPLISVTSVSYVDTAGSTQTLSPSVYTVITGPVAAIDLAYGQSWPDTRNQPRAVTVVFHAGYGAAEAVPAAIRQAIQLMVADMYTFRASAAEGRWVEIPSSAAAERLLAPFRVIQI